MLKGELNQVRPNVVQKNINSIINTHRGTRPSSVARFPRLSLRAPAKVMICSRSALTPCRIARAHRRRSAQPSRLRDGGVAGDWEERVRRMRGDHNSVHRSSGRQGECDGKRTLLWSWRREGGPTKQGEDKRGKRETGDHDDDGAAGLSPESESERAPPGVRVRSPGRS